jgi:hypothetical protein
MFAHPNPQSGIVSMQSDAIVFSVDGEDYRWRDVIVAAVRWGEWAEADRRTRQGIAAMHYSEETSDPLPAGALDSAAKEFRYARDLVTALSMEQWLGRWSITAKDWTGHLKRELHRTRWPAIADALIGRYEMPDDYIAPLALVDAMCSGALDEWAKTLASRVAAVQTIASRTTAADPLDPPAAIQQLLGDDVETMRKTSARLQQLDEAFEQFRSTQVTEPALREFVATRQLDWVRFDCRSMSFAAEDMAAEAALLLREDGEGFTGVYSVAHAIPQVLRFYVDHLDGPLRDQFLAARTGDLVGPALVNNEYVLYLIQDKVLPTVRDPEVRRRAEEGVLQHVLRQQLDSRVRWHVSAP